MTCPQWQTHPIATRRILIVEDEAIVALNYASILEDAGCQIVGPVGTIQKGIEAVENERIDAAVLDIDIGGVPVDPIIMALRRKRLPYIFVSALSGLVERYQGAVFLDKPCTAAQLIKAVNALFLKARVEWAGRFRA
jgi:DNA-binding response OmpR family regulator